MANQEEFPMEVTVDILVILISGLAGYFIFPVFFVLMAMTIGLLVYNIYIYI